MTWPNFYDTGTVSIGAGATVAVGTGTFWSSLSDQANLLIVAGQVAFVDVVTDNTHLAIPAWQGGAVTGSDYRLVQFPVSSLQATKQLRDFLAATSGIGVIYSVTDDAPDPSIGDDGDYALKTNSGAWKQWLKVSGVWALQATPVGVTNRIPEGDWNSATSFQVNDITRRLGVIYLSNTANINKPPESNPADWATLSAKGDTGATGATGAAGTVVRYGTGAPSGGTGLDGDFYISTDTHLIYGPKASGVWPAGTPLVGPTGGTGTVGATGAAGADGKTLRFGTGAPSGTLGHVGDFYIATDTNTLYGPMGSGSWPPGVSIVGPQGIQGLQGQGIDPGATGTLAQRSASFDGQPQGFTFLQTDVSPFRLWVKASNTSGDWAGPSYIGGQGPIGDGGHITDSLVQTFDGGHIV